MARLSVIESMKIREDFNYGRIMENCTFQYYRMCDISYVKYKSGKTKVTPLFGISYSRLEDTRANVDDPISTV